MAIRDEIIAQAKARQGIPYRLDPPPDGVSTLDCSLFVLQVAASAGVALPSGVRTAEQIRQATVPIGFDEVLPGDLLFFEGTYDAAGPAGPDGRIASHIGISLGAGSRRMWDANDAHGVSETNIGTPYWQEKIFESRRLPQLAAAAPSVEQLRGIDVSNWQGDPLWSEVAASGVAFGIAKATQRTNWVDKTFARNWFEMKRVRLVRGAYHFAEPDASSPQAEAEHFLATIERAGGLKPGDVVALDLEDYEGSLARANDVGGWSLAFLRHVEAQTGIKPFFYTNPSVIAEHSLGGYPALAEYPLWLASYRASQPAPPAPWSEIAIWQHSSTGRVPGIDGNVDLNVFNGSRQQLVALGKGGSVEQPPTFTGGEGILAAMAARGDQPATDEIYHQWNTETAFSEAFGTSGSRYVWLPITGRVHRYDPAA